MRTTPISQKEQKRMKTLGLGLDVGQGILTLTGAGEIVNEVIDIFIYVGFLGYMYSRKIQTSNKILKLTLIFAAEEVPGLDLFWFWRNFVVDTLYEGVPGNEGIQGGEMPDLGGMAKPPVISQRSPQKPQPLNATPGTRLPRK